MLTILRLAVWALPLAGLLKTRERHLERQTFTPRGVAGDLDRIIDSMLGHAATLAPETAAPLRAIARNIQDSRDDLLSWGETATPRQTSGLRRLFQFR